MNSVSREKPPPIASPARLNSNGEDDIDDQTEHGVTEDQPDSDKWESKAPDGGTTAWLALLGSWCMLFCTFGLINGNNGSLLEIIRVDGDELNSAFQPSAPFKDTTKRSCSKTIQPAQSLGFRPCRYSLHISR